MGIFRRKREVDGDDGAGAEGGEEERRREASDGVDEDGMFGKYAAADDGRRQYLVEVEQIPSKRIGDEVRGAKDLRRFVNAEDASFVALDVRVKNAKETVDFALMKMVEADLIPAELVSDARKALLLHHGLDESMNNNNTTADLHQVIVGAETAESTSCSPSAEMTTTQESPMHKTTTRTEDDVVVVDESDESVDAVTEAYSWKKSIHGGNFIVSHARVMHLEHRVSAFMRLSPPVNLGGNVGGGIDRGGGAGDCELTHFVVVVLAPAVETKATKSALETAKNFATVLLDARAYDELVAARSEKQVRDAVGCYVDREEAFVHDGYENATGTVVGDDPFAEMQRTGRLFGGLVRDIRRNYKWDVYRTDWTDGLNEWRSVIKYISVTAWLYFAVIMPVVAFGSLNDANTVKAIGISETVLSQAICGLSYSIFAAQPLAIPMVTGPVSVFISVLWLWTDALGIEFLPFFGWTGLWGSLLLILIVAFDLIAYIRYVGQFTEEIFAMLVACIFISQYIKPLVDTAENESTTVFLLSFVLATGMFVMARVLSTFERSFYLNATTRTLLADFGMPFSVLVWSGVRQIFTNVDVSSLEVPDRTGIVTTSGRSWLVPLGNLSVGHVFLAIVPALFLVMLFYVDQNVAVLLTNKRENKLKKDVGYSLDMMVVAANMIMCSLLGVPWTNAAVPHSHLHARMLADSEEYEAHGRCHERIIRARETRITNFTTHLLILASMFLLVVVGYIPSSVVWGFFLYIGVATLDGNQMFERALLIFVQPEKYPPNHFVRRVALRKIFLYTAIQVTLLVFLWLVNENFYIEGGVFKAGLLFPLIIMLFIPIRVFFLPRFFTRRELHALEMEKEDH